MADATTTDPKQCLAEEWHRDGRGRWAMRKCGNDAAECKGGRWHPFLPWQYNVQPLLSASQPIAPTDRGILEREVFNIVHRGGLDRNERVDQLQAEVTALHAERDRLVEQLADANKQREAFAAKYIEAIERLEKRAGR